MTNPIIKLLADRKWYRKEYALPAEMGDTYRLTTDVGTAWMAARAWCLENKRPMLSELNFRTILDQHNIKYDKEGN